MQGLAQVGDYMPATFHCRYDAFVDTFVALLTSKNVILGQKTHHAEHRTKLVAEAPGKDFSFVLVCLHYLTIVLFIYII